jgi:carboxypeptidase D
MRWTSFLSALLLSGSAEAAGRSIAHAGKHHVEHAAKRAKTVVARDYHHRVVEREEKEHKFLNANTTSECSVAPIDQEYAANLSS